ncbi:hypothetical protein [Cerasicoccus frondis]|uniref:hypothetical protein n=1 Tax=Cerasicoccus frondis TaxID=490090 RepID=UPI00285292D7|nr:hypothetical protein [Cerasicoccus frondis]
MSDRHIKGVGSIAAPTVFFSLCLILLLGLLYIAPIFAEMFADFGVELPRLTQLLIDVGMFLKYNLAVTAGLFVAIIGGFAVATSSKIEQDYSGVFWGLSAVMLILAVLSACVLFLPTFKVNSVVGP